MGHPSGDRQVWSASLAGVLISAYLWIAYSDQLATTTLAVGGLPSAIGGAAIGGVLSCVLLFLPTALQGVRTRMPMMVVATSAFGIRGSSLVPGLVLGLVQILWFSVAVHYAVEFNLRGLRSAGLIDPEELMPASGGGRIHESTVYAASVLLWGIASALVATRFIRWIAALMVVYPIFLAMALGGAMAWSIPGLPLYQEAAADPALLATWAEWPAFWSMTQLVFGFSAMVCAQSTNWGASLRGPRDVVLAGVVGVGLASTILASIAVLTVAGSIGREIAPEPPATSSAGPSSPIDLDAPLLSDPVRGNLLPDPGLTPAYTLGNVFEQRVGGIPGALGLIVLGLGSMAPAVYASYAYSNRLEAIRGRPRRWAWGVVGALAAFPLMTNGLAANVPLVIDLTAGVIAPMLGVLSADLLMTRSSWPGPRSGFRPGGLIGWGLGSMVGLLPIVARMAPVLGGCRWLPMALIAYGVAFGTFLMVEGIGTLRRHRGRVG
jgi:cytosine permease